MFGKFSLSSGSQQKSNLFSQQSVRPKEARQGQVKITGKGPLRQPASSEKKSSNPNKNKPIKKQQKAVKRDDIQKKYEDLQGAKFRILNQLLYTSNSQNSKNFFIDNRQDFQLYHEGYRHQTTKWKYRPVDQVIAYLVKHTENYANKKIIDLGCGEGFLQEELVKHGFNPKKIGSYDLVSLKPFIKEADIANLPIKDGVADLCVFCLSLMGTNYLNFIRQAWRVLKNEGELIISEVESRSPNWKKFVEMIELVGFKMVNNGCQLVSAYSQNQGRFFRTMLFRKSAAGDRKKGIRYEGQTYDTDTFSQMMLKSCKYKKR